MTARRRPPRWQQLPRGTRDWKPADLAALRALEAGLRGEFARWGYREVATPTLETLDTVAHGVGVAAPDALFKVLDRTGEILVLRPDMTVPLARVVAMGDPADADARFCYFAPVFRGQERTRGGQREFHQAGIERIGRAGADADAEVIALAVAALEAAGAGAFQIGIGHAAFLRALLNEAELDEEEQHTAQALLFRRDFVTLRDLLSQSPPRVAEMILALPSLRGDAAIARAASVPAAAAALEELRAVQSALDAYGLDLRAEIDLGLIRDFDYYTGIVFEGYAQGHGLTLLGGGRYDGLMSRFGRALPAIGFAIEVERVLSWRGAVAGGSAPLRIVYEPSVRVEAIAAVRGLRALGFAVAADPAVRDAAPAGAWIFRAAGAHRPGKGGPSHPIPVETWRRPAELAEALGLEGDAMGPTAFAGEVRTSTP
jgi:ATP phosphoribosyltransferase regulatory subunit